MLNDSSKTPLNIVFVGAWPLPYGGVAEFTRRLTLNFPDQFERIIVRSKKSLALPSKYKFVKANNLAILLLWCLYLKLRSPSYFHFNFSTSAALFALMLMPHWHRNIIMLHNGMLHLSKRRLPRFLQKQLLSRAKYVIALNTNQLEEYITVIGANKNLILASSYLSDPNTAARHDKHSYDIFWSGFPTDNYGLHWLLEYASKNRHLKFCLVVYGTEQHTPCLKQISQYSNVTLFSNVNPTQFSELLDQSRILARPTKVDSVGISVCDAALKGLTIVASSCCPRPPGSIIFDCGNQVDFNNAIDKALLTLQKCDQKLTLSQFDSRGTLETLYASLL